MDNLFDSKHEFKLVQNQVECFKEVRLTLKEAHFFAAEYHSKVNDNVLIKIVCEQYGLSISDYWQTTRFFNEYLTMIRHNDRQ
jgi:hypothetical protein